MMHRMKRFLVDVTAEHIRKGRRLNCEECVVALAMNDLGLGKWMVNSVWFWNTLGWEVVSPRAAVEIIEAFDSEQPVKPCSFEIEIPEHLLPASGEAGRTEEDWATLGR